MSNAIIASNQIDAAALSVVTRDTNRTQYINLPSSGKAKGAWSIGDDAEVLPAGTRVALDPMSMEWGHTVWSAGRPIVTSAGPRTQPKPPEPTVDDNGTPLDIDGETQRLNPHYAVKVALQDGSTAIIRGGTDGLIQALEAIMVKVARRARANEAKLIPIVELGVDSYTHPKFGKVIKPVMTVVDWM